MREESINGIIYCYTNTINGKKYVGQTTESYYARRHYRHKYMDGPKDSPFYRAIAKYGYDSFTLENIETGIKSSAELSNREIFWIKELNSKVPHGYNLTDGGEGTRGYTVPEHKRRKGMLNHNFGRIMPLSVKEALRVANERPEVKEAIRERGRQKSVTYMGENNPFYGKKHSAESKAKNSASRSGQLVGADNPSARAVICIEINRLFLTMKEAGAWLNSNSYCNISSVCTGKIKSYKGFRWRYATEEEVAAYKSENIPQPDTKVDG